MREALFIKEYTTGELHKVGVIKASRWESLIDKARELSKQFYNMGRFHIVEINNNEIYAIYTFDDGIRPSYIDEPKTLFKRDIDKINKLCELGKNILIKNRPKGEN